MIKLKSQQDIELIKQGGRILRQVLDEIKPVLKAGVSTDHIDRMLDAKILDYGGEPGFKRVPGYKWASCLCINDQVVHTPPSGRRLGEGDIFTIDCGVYHHGFHTDAADTIIIGQGPNEKKQAFLDAGKKTLDKAIEVAKAGNRIGHISRLIDTQINQAGYSIIKELTGHGLGVDLHEDPVIPGFLNEPLEQTPQIVPGMVLAIEVIYAESSAKIKSEAGDRWSLVTDNGDLSACFEKTIAITDKETLILT